MKFIIADDVYYARKAVEKMVREWNAQSKILALCDNGDSVLEQLEKEKADVLILDIKMPGADGLQLSGIVHARWPEIKIVLVSGYADFEYARTALNNEVFAYLLKPLEKAELFDALNRLAQVLQTSYENKQSLQETARAASSFRVMRFLARQEETAGPKEFPMDEKALADGYYVAQCTLPLRFLESLRELATGCFGDGVLVFEDILHENNSILIVCNTRKQAKTAFKAVFHSGAEALGESLFRLYGGAVLSCSKQLAGSEGLPKAYRQAKRAYALRLVHPQQVVLYFEENPGAEPVLQPEDLRVLNKKLKGQKKEEAVRFLQERLRAGGCPLRLPQLEQFYYEALSVCSGVAYANGSTSDEIRLPRQPWSFEGAEQMLQYLCGLPFQKEAAAAAGEGDLIQDIQNFLEENYYCELSLNELAATRYYMNPNYLGRLFKSKTGIGFSRYLLNLRMNKAKRLLQTGATTINEVAAMVGYTSTSYFIQNYKKHFGETPGNTTKDIR